MDLQKIKLYTPCIISVLLLFSLFFIEDNTTNKEMSISLLKVVDYKINVANYVVIKGLIILSVVCSLGSYAFIDYSKIFPTSLNVNVYYDQEGIEENLKVFKERDLLKLPMMKNYKEAQEVYYTDVDKELHSIVDTRGFFAVGTDTIFSKGKTSFVVKKMNGLQRYCIVDAKGELHHQIEIANNPGIKFLTFFDKIDSKHDHINLKLKSVLIKQSIILRPIFKQILAEKLNSKSIEFHHILCGMTKIILFPYPKFSNTVYFFKFNDYYVPIGYGIYQDC